MAEYVTLMCGASDRHRLPWKRLKKDTMSRGSMKFTVR